MGMDARIEVVRTAGDRVPDRPLATFGGKGIFVREIEEALLAGSIDLAVHSLKDLPTTQPDGLVARSGPTLATLRPAAVVGTGSPRRACQIRARRPDLAIRDVRGNVD